MPPFGEPLRIDERVYSVLIHFRPRALLTTPVPIASTKLPVSPGHMCRLSFAWDAVRQRRSKHDARGSRYGSAMLSLYLWSKGAGVWSADARYGAAEVSS